MLRLKWKKNPAEMQKKYDSLLARTDRLFRQLIPACRTDLWFNQIRKWWILKARKQLQLIDCWASRIKGIEQRALENEAKKDWKRWVCSQQINRESAFSIQMFPAHVWVAKQLDWTIFLQGHLPQQKSKSKMVSKRQLSRYWLKLVSHLPNYANFSFFDFLKSFVVIAWFMDHDCSKTRILDIFWRHSGCPKYEIN